MAYRTLIAPSELMPKIGDPDWAMIDCRFSLEDTRRGARDYLQAHIPGAVYAHLDEDLCGPIIPGQTGRHPLPPVQLLVEKLSKWGIDSSVQVVAYDDASGAMAAARLWWMLRWLGHTAVAVLDGGWQGWKEGNYPVVRGEETRPPRAFIPQIDPTLLVEIADIERMIQDPDFLILDVRSAERYRGDFEPIDPVAGHIPSAVSAPYSQNVDSDGYFLPVEKLRARYQKLIGDTPAEQAVFYCGSGVTAAQSVLALAHAGLGDARLYSGSWSEWITDPSRSIEKGS